MLAELFSLEHRVIIITGAYGHLGKAFVDVLAAAKAIVYVCGRSADRFAERFPKHPANVHFTELDISKPESFPYVLSKILRKEARLDVLINNAFYGPRTAWDKMNIAEWNEGLAGVLTAVFEFGKLCIEYLKESDQARIINVSSIYGLVAPDMAMYKGFEHMTNPINYGVAKAGLIQLSKYWASALAPWQICVNNLIPGAFPNPTAGLDEEFIQRLAEHSLLNRIGRPEDLQGAVLLLASRAASFITGQSIIVDGGWTVR